MYRRYFEVCFYFRLVTLDLKLFDIFFQYSLKNLTLDEIFSENPKLGYNKY